MTMKKLDRGGVPPWIHQCKAFNPYLQTSFYYPVVSSVNPNAEPVRIQIPIQLYIVTCCITQHFIA